MRFKSIINLGISIAFFLIGTFFADAYKNPLYAVWLLSLFVYTFGVQWFLQKVEDLDNEIDDLNRKISLLTIGKREGDNHHQVAFNLSPYGVINNVGTEFTFNVYVSSITPFVTVPELKLITKKEWEIKVQNQEQKPNQFGGGNEYYLKSPTKNSKELRLLHYSFQVKINDKGKHYFTVEVNDGTIEGTTSISNYIEIE